MTKRNYPFSEYEDRIKQTFDQWGIHPREIYYTTVTEANHSHNQLEVLKRDVFELLRVQPGIHDRVIHAMEALIYHHQSFLKSKYETASEDSYSALNDAEMKEAAKLQKALSSINEVH